MPHQITYNETTLDDIREAMNDNDGDSMAQLTAVDKILTKCGFPHVDPLNVIDHEAAALTLIYLQLCGRDWFPNMIWEVDRILDASPDTLDHPEN